MRIAIQIKTTTYSQIVAFNGVLALSKNISKNKLDNCLLCCFCIILALHLKLNQKTMFVQASNKKMNLSLSHEQAYAILAYKNHISSKVKLDSYTSVVFMDITAQLHKQLQ